VVRQQRQENRGRN